MRVEIHQHNSEVVLTGVPFWCTPRRVADTLARLSGVACRIDRSEEGDYNVSRQDSNGGPIFNVNSMGHGEIIVWYKGLSSYASVEVVRDLPGEIRNPFYGFLKSFRQGL
ncbi:hypothetical protein J4405_02965 [Candidatus Woesearchaeota archaeon]|nr:hypothetical protein [Candidatus Woesearchaeota archaeon]